MKVRTVAPVFVALGAAMLGIAVAAGPAMADPGAGEFRPLVGVGSDTTQDVVNGLGNVIVPGGSKVIASYDARGTARIKSRAAACEFTRPNGSSDGRVALRASIGDPSSGVYKGDVITGCVDFARSSSYASTTPGISGQLTYIPFGVDAVTYAYTGGGALPQSLTLVELQRIYRCQLTTIGGKPVKPLLVQSGSGTRQSWLQRMGITEADLAAGDYPCIDTRNNTIQEHDGTVLATAPDSIVPFSIGQYIAQGNAAAILAQTGVTITDRRGPAVLGRVNGIEPVVGGKLNTGFQPEMLRDVYNVVPTAKLTDAAIATAFVGRSSQVCAARATIELFGFGYRETPGGTLFFGACGDTALKANT
jgi:ABC-type phosphate transport system substrate-binding protein